MSDTAQGLRDLDTLTDDEINALSAEQIEAYMGQEEGQENVEPEPENTAPEDDAGDDPAGDTSADADDTASGDDDDDVSEGDDPEDAEGSDPEPAPEANVEGIDPNAVEEKAADPKAETPAEPEGGKPEAEGDPKPEAKKAPDAKQAVDPAAADFMTKVTAPFKADGREMRARTAEDVIRLMQMGANYSRKMQELKPLKVMEDTLAKSGLTDPAKLNKAIDIMSGNKDAIRDLLKQHNIDPLDIDTSNETPYQPKNHQSDPKDVAFREAVKATVKAPGGHAIITDINNDWDDTSKEALRETPVIFDNLLAQKNSGIYDRIITELNYHKTIDPTMVDVPFLQAYHRVGDAMEKAGAFKTENKTTPAAPKVPLDTGPRKAAPKPKTEQPNPDLSSISQPRVAPPKGGDENEPDYSTMSDEDFMKLAPPA